MSDITGVRITVVEVDTNDETPSSEIVCDFYNGKHLVGSNHLNDKITGHIIDYHPDFEFTKIVIRTESQEEPVGEALLTQSFLSKCKLDSRNEQWIPLSSPFGRELTASHFRMEEVEAPSVKARFELIDTAIESPIKQQAESIVHRREIRSSYNFRNEGRATSPPRAETSRSGRSSGRNQSSHRTASLRRKGYGVNMPMQSSKSREAHRTVEGGSKLSRSVDEYTSKKIVRQSVRPVITNDLYYGSSNYYIPEDRDHLQRKLNNLVSDIKDRHDEIQKENDECFRILDWINKMGSEPFSNESTTDEEISYTKEVKKEIETFYSNINRDDEKEIGEMQAENDKLKDQLAATQKALKTAILQNDDLKKNLDIHTSDPSSNVAHTILKTAIVESADIDKMRKENRSLNDEILQTQLANKKKIIEYLESLEDPVDLHQLGRSFRGLTEEYKDAIKQFHEEKKGLIQDVNGANDELSELVKNGIRLKKK